MKIIILGSGKFSETLAKYLLIENNDITVVDNNKLCLYRLQEKLDLRVVLGYVGYPEVLREAGAEEADILIAATDSDELNMIACQISYSFFSIPKCIASIQSIDYIDIEDKIFPKNQGFIYYFIHPEKMIINCLINFIEYPGVLKVIYLCNDNVVLSLLRISNHSDLVGMSISDLKRKISDVNFFIPMIVRDNIPFFSIHSTIFKTNDKFFLLCLSKDFLKLINNLKNVVQITNRNIMLLGGGNIGFGIARILEKKCNITIIESNKKRARMLSKYLEYSTVLCGNASDFSLLSEENIDKIDIFFSITDNDDINIMSSIIAKKMGSKKSIALVQNKFYLELVNFSKEIDEIIFPQEVIISELLNQIRPLNIISLFFFQIGKIEVIEIIVKRKNYINNVIGSLLSDIKISPSIIIFAIIKNNDLIFCNNFDYIRIEEEDHIIMLCNNRNSLKCIKKIF